MKDGHYLYFFRRVQWSSSEDMSQELNAMTRGAKVVGMSSNPDEVIVLIEVGPVPLSDPRFT